LENPIEQYIYIYIYIYTWKIGHSVLLYKKKLLSSNTKNLHVLGFFGENNLRACLFLYFKNVFEKN